MDSGPTIAGIFLLIAFSAFAFTQMGTTGNSTIISGGIEIGKNFTSIAMSSAFILALAIFFKRFA